MAVAKDEKRLENGKRKEKEFHFNSWLMVE